MALTNDCDPCAGWCVDTEAPIHHTGDGSGPGTRCLVLRWSACDAILGGQCNGTQALLLPAVGATATSPFQPARAVLWTEKWTGNIQGRVVAPLFGGDAAIEVAIPAEAIHSYIVRSEYLTSGSGCVYTVSALVAVNNVSTGFALSQHTREVLASPGQTIHIEWQLGGDTSCVSAEIFGIGIETNSIVVDCGLPTAGTCSPVSVASGATSGGGVGCGLRLAGGVTAIDAGAIAGSASVTSLAAFGTCSLQVLVDGVTITRSPSGALQVASFPASSITGLCAQVRPCISATTPLAYDQNTGVIALTAATAGMILTSTGAGAVWAFPVAQRTIVGGCGISVVYGSDITVSLDLPAITGYGLVAGPGCVIGIDPNELRVAICTALGQFPASSVPASTSTKIFGGDCTSYTICDLIRAMPRQVGTYAFGNPNIWLATDDCQLVQPGPAPGTVLVGALAGTSGGVGGASVSFSNPSASGNASYIVTYHMSDSGLTPAGSVFPVSFGADPYGFPYGVVNLQNSPTADIQGSVHETTSTAGTLGPGGSGSFACQVSGGFTPRARTTFLLVYPN